jgi:AraC-like DNA-binding protein
MPKSAKQPAPAYTVSAELIRGLIDCARRIGVPRLESPEVKSASDATASPARFAAEHIFALWERLIRLSGDPIIGHRMALVADAKTFGLLGQALVRCATVLEAFQQVARYSMLVYQGTRVTVERGDANLVVTVTSAQPPGPVACNAMLWMLTNLSLMPLRLTELTSRPNRIECAIESPGEKAERELRDRLPFELGTPASRVIFDRRIGDLKVKTADAELHSVLSQVLDQRLAELKPAETFEQGMELVLRGMISGKMPTLAALSARTGMSPRTLQRRLSESRTNFNRLLQGVLRNAADELLARGTLTQGEIAFLLGYSEESALSRAYRSWTGRPPGAAYARANQSR